MTALWLYIRADLRRRWRSWLAVTIVVVLGAGAGLALVAGARRTDTAYPRFLRAVRAPDVRMFLSLPPQGVDEILELPEVDEATRATGLMLADRDLGAVVLDDPNFGRSLARFKMLDGRLPRSDRADEALVSFLVARDHHLKVGSTLTVHVVIPRGEASDVQPVTLRVVGVEATAGELPPQAAVYSRNAVYLSPAFLHTPTGAQAVAGDRSVAVNLRLRAGAADAPAFIADALRVSEGAAAAEAMADNTARVQRSMNQQAVALWLVAAAAAVALVLILSQLLVRQFSDEADDAARVQALGMTASDVAATALVRLLAMGVVAAAGAVAVAFAASPLLPRATARVAEPHPGLAFDATALGIGAAGVIIVVVATGALAWRTSRHRARAAALDVSSVSLGARLARLPLPFVSTTGIRLALQRGGGRAAVPVRATLVATTVGLASVVGALTLGASVGHLLATPRLYGVSFDADVQTSPPDGDVRPLVAAVRGDATVEAAAVAWTGVSMRSGDVDFGAEATVTVEGVIAQTVIHGRLPAASDEILLGTETARALHTEIGRTVSVTVGDLTGALPMRVVGLGILAPFTATEQLGRGAVVAPSALDAFLAMAPPGFPPPPPTDLLVRFKPGVDPAGATVALSTELGGPGRVAVLPARPPADVATFGQVRSLPGLLAAVLALIAAAAVAHLVVSSVRRRRAHLAVLKSLGMVPRQVSAVIAWQASTVAVIALVVGAPLGVAAGRWLWFALAAQVGVVPEPSVPWALLGLLGPAVVLLANVVAAGPALAAGRIRPAVALHAA